MDRREFITKGFAGCLTYFLFFILGCGLDRQEQSMRTIEGVQRKAKALVIEYLQSENYRRRLMAMFYRASLNPEKWKKPSVNLEDKFGNVGEVMNELAGSDSINSEDIIKLKKRVDDYIKEKTRKIDGTKLYLVDNIYNLELSKEDLSATETVAGISVDLNYIKTVENYQSKLKLMFSEEVFRIIIESIKKDDEYITFAENKHFVAGSSNIFFLNLLVHEYLHTDGRLINFYNTQSFIRPNDHMQAAKDLSSNLELPVYIQTYLILLKKFSYIEDYQLTEQDMIMLLEKTISANRKFGGEKWEDIKEMDRLEYLLFIKQNVFLQVLKLLRLDNHNFFKDRERDNDMIDLLWLFNNLAGINFRNLENQESDASSFESMLCEQLVGNNVEGNWV